MKLLPIDGCYSIVDPGYQDDRGSIKLIYDICSLNELFNATTVKMTRSIKGVVRGIHGDSKTSKIVTCVSGAILQVVVDFRRFSPTYGKKYVVTIEDGSSSILVPRGCGNAYQTLSDDSIYVYALSNEVDQRYIDVDEQFTFNPLSPDLSIPWRETPILSQRDASAEYFRWR